MSDKSWKQLEREVGTLIGGARYPANQGGDVDVESDDIVVQVKERKALSLEALTKLVEQIEGIGKQKGKRGLVAVKVRRGRGRPSPVLIIQSAEQWRRKEDECDEALVRRVIHGRVERVRPALDDVE